MTPPAPNLLPIHNYHILETRNRKLLKLIIMKDRSRQSAQDEEDVEDSDANMILSQLNNSNYSATSSAKEEDSDEQSFDSQPHNAYESDIRNERDRSLNQDINLRDYPDFLVVEFKVQEEPPKINIIPPQPPPPPEKVTVSIAVQTIPEKKSEKEEKKEQEAKARQKEKERERQKQKQREREKERQRQRERERQKEQRQKWEKEQREHQEREKARAKAVQGKKEAGVSSNNEGLGIRSQIKQKAILTESMEMVGSPKEEKKKGSTFMDYYNSIPVKSPTNILQKYLKRKK